MLVYASFIHYTAYAKLEQILFEIMRLDKYRKKEDLSVLGLYAKFILEEVQHLEAHPCNDCEDACEGFIVETVDNGGNVTPTPNDHQQPQDETTCNCTGRMGPCPLEGDCRKEKNVIDCCIHLMMSYFPT